MSANHVTVNELVKELTCKGESSQSCALGIFNRMSLKLAEVSSQKETYQIIGEGLNELLPDSMVIINSFEDSSGLFQVEALVGVNRFLGNIARIMKRSPIGVQVPINDLANKELLDGTLKSVPGGLFELALGVLSKETCNIIEKLINLHIVYAIGFRWQGRLYGSANFLLSGEVSPIDGDLVQSFVSLASLALQRWHTGENLRISEKISKELAQSYQRIARVSTDMMFQIDLDGNFLFTNESFRNRLGYSEKQIKELNGFNLVHPDDLAHFKQYFNSLINGRSIENLEYRNRKKDGSYVNVISSICPMLDSQGKVNSGFGIAQNITERKKFVDNLQEHSNRLEKLVAERTSELASVNKKLKHELYERGLAQEESKRAVEQYENLMATAPFVIGRTDLKTKVLYVNQKFEEFTGYTKDEVVGKYWPSLGIMTADYATALIKRMEEKLSGKPTMSMEIPVRCKDGTIKYVAGIGQILREKGIPIAFQVIAQDVTDRKEAQLHAEATTKRLLKALEDMIYAMVMTVELRDPYTAGHQRRVAELATAIGNDIGLSSEQIEGIRYAGLVHDIGKIRVPAQILTYPGNLTEPEMRVMQLHPEVGYQILEKIEFPWPIARAVLQHHERMDGSGYPSGLKGEDIILEARILGVADAVEAMTSHRPYRAALATDKALKEIASKKDILYDSKIVDSCTRLFKKKRFKYEMENHIRRHA